MRVFKGQIGGSVMFQRNVCRHRYVVLCFALMVFAYAAPAQFKLTKGYCSSTPDEPVVYFTQFAKEWARSAAVSRGLPPQAADCAAERFETGLRAKPVLKNAKTSFEASIEACKRN